MMSDLIKIPQGWSVKEIQELGKVVTGSTPKTSEEENWIGTLPFVSPTDLTDRKYLQSTERQVNKNVINRNRIIPKNSIMYSCIASIGKMSISSEECTTNQQINTIIPTKEFDYNYLYYSLLYKTNYIKTLSAMTAVPIINKGLFSKIKLTIPPLKEQQKIAAILSSVDEAIEKTEQIIDQTEKVKKGLMQELFFKGIGNKDFKNTILGDIPRHWDIVQTGDLFENKSVKKHEHLEVLTVTQEQGVVFRKDFDMNIKFNQSSLPNYKKVDPGDFIISLRSFQGGLELSTYEGIVSPAYTVLQHKQNIDIEYFKYFLKSYWFIEQLKASTIGIRDGKQISYQDFKLIKIPLPPLKEQIKMSKILTQIDKELDFENNWQSKLVELKKGLMQELLTGKKRVKVDDSEEVLS